MRAQGWAVKGHVEVMSLTTLPQLLVKTFLGLHAPLLSQNIFVIDLLIDHVCEIGACILDMPVQPVTPVGDTVQIKQLIVVPDRVLCTRYFVLYTVCL